MSSYDKVIKGATKPKSGGIKPKYIDPIIATTFATDGSLQDVCRALGNRLREPNATVVLKSLVILHTMIRNGEVDNVLSHLSSDIGNIRLRNVFNNSWSGYSAPQTLSVYAQYLDERVRAYRELKHDVIRSSDRSRAHSNGASNSNRLRKLSVEKGLLREVSATQKVASVLMQCSFFLDDLNDDLIMSAFRMTLKDLLAIYTATNEGVINILEHYFEMAKSDAERALELYRRFCRQTENVVAFLNSAKKASHSLNLAIPSLKHAPVSLAGALEEYLKDPNFEQNRQEYKENKRIADGTPAASTARPTSTTSNGVPKSESKKSITIQEPDKPERKVKPPTSNQDLQDFFASIDNNGAQNIFSNVPAEQSFFLQAQPTGMMAMNGQGFGSTGMGMTGLGALQPQMTGYNPFMAQQQTGMQMPMHQQMAGFGGMQPQMTGFIQPQATGFNPFRQSIMPQPTGFGGPFGAFDGQSSMFSQQQQQQQQQSTQQQPQQHQQQQQQQNQPFHGLQPQHTATPSQPQVPGQQASSSALGQLPNQQQSSALSSFNSAFQSQSNGQQSNPSQPPATSSPAKPLLPQKTGSRNPFAPPPGSTPPPASPPAPKGPSLNQLAMSAFGAPDGGHYSLGANAWDGTDPTGKNASNQHQQQQSGAAGSGLLAPQKTGLIGSVASEFAFSNQNNSSSTTNNANSGFGHSTPSGAVSTPTGQQPANDLTSQFGALSFVGSGQPQQPQTQALQPQPTGFGGSSIRPFKPESSFGASLASNPQFGSGAAAGGNSGGVAPQMTGNPFARVASPPLQQQQQFTGLGALNSNATGNGAFGASASTTSGLPPSSNHGALRAFNSAFGSTPGVTQSQQQQGQSGTPYNSLGGASGGFNGSSGSTTNAFGSGQQSQLQPQPTGFGGSSIKPFQPTSDFGKGIRESEQPNLSHF
ncbi:hypothetical protein EX895_004561 [Sporisorium graminicola]|uniref:ENTH domain-containing protein n=1 Tax=Sporisorium graminicola TaxID=280036 RepID=A0A4U7KTW1_9BASI|nr:hypothetical protein EX895_004561 [Sporisorium graminicola]TKY86412.1 hypothetical protein EX895_004561 [Sporisorium graminicola]